MISFRNVYYLINNSLFINVESRIKSSFLDASQTHYSKNQFRVVTDIRIQSIIKTENNLNFPNLAHIDSDKSLKA